MLAGNTRSNRPWMVLMPLLAAVITVAACAPGIRLASIPADPAALPPGTYTLVLYGCGHPQRINNLVILAPEGSAWSHEVHGPKFEYTVRTGVPAAEALGEADRFLRCSVYYRKTQLRSIQGPDGQTLGYELRPLYLPYDFGREDVFLNDVRLVDGHRVISYINLHPSVDRLINGEYDASPSSAGGPVGR